MYIEKFLYADLLTGFSLNIIVDHHMVEPLSGPEFFSGGCGAQAADSDVDEGVWDSMAVVASEQWSKERDSDETTSVRDLIPNGWVNS